MKESDIQNQIRDYLRVKGWFIVRNHQSLGNHRGRADLSCFGPDGEYMEVEVKSPKGGKLSDHQIEYQFQLECRGHTYVVARSLEDVLEALK